MYLNLWYVTIFDLKNKKTDRTESGCPKQKERFDRANGMVEFLSRAIHFIVVEAGVPGIILPKAILSFYKYVATDAKNDAFQLAVVSS